jgi:Rod binding domain-containing protein
MSVAIQFMNPVHAAPSADERAAPSRFARPHAPFTAALAQAMGPAGAPRSGIAREAATQLVSSAFIVPVLKAMRESADLAGPFAPGEAERRFAPLLDEQIADRIASAANFPLVDAIVNRFANAAGRKP